MGRSRPAARAVRGRGDAGGRWSSPPEPREADRLDPDLADNPHLGFGSGIHYCFGGPLARVEAQVALPALARRLRNPRLVADPPPYRPNPTLRGPRHLMVEFNGPAPAEEAAGVIPLGTPAGA